MKTHTGWKTEGWFGVLLATAVTCAVVGSAFGAGRAGPANPLAEEDTPETAIDLSKEVPPKAEVKAASKPADKAEALPPAELVVPAGEHRMGMLSLTTPDNKTLMLYIRLRDGKVTGQHGFLQGPDGQKQQLTSRRHSSLKWDNPWDCSGLKLDGAGLSGEVKCRLSRIKGYRDCDFKIAGTVAKDGALTGACNEAPLIGWVRDDAQMKAVFGLAEGHDWPGYLGPNRDWSATDAPVTWQWVDRLEDAQMVWFGEEFQSLSKVSLHHVIKDLMPPEDRLKHFQGGISSPIVDGRIFIRGDRIYCYDLRKPSTK